MTAYERIVDALGDRLGQVNGTRARARFPGHDGQSHTSLAITDNPRGPIFTYDNGRTVHRYHRNGQKLFSQANTQAPPELYRLSGVKEAVAAGKPGVCG